MKHSPLALAASVAAATLVAASCYQGRQDVPHQSGAGGAGAGATNGPGGLTGIGASPATGGSGPSTGPGAGAGTQGSGGGAADPCANTIFCDDFEGYAAGNPPGGMWGNNQSGGSLAVDTGKSHSGSKAVKVVANASSGYRSIMMRLSDASIFPVSGGKIYGRMMFFLESSPDTSVHWTFIDGSGLVPGQNYHSIYRYGGQQPVTDGSGNFLGSQLMANYETPDSYQTPAVGPSSDCWLHSNKHVVPVGSWSCAEWYFDTPNDTMRFWLDGTELTDLKMTGTGQGCVNQAADFAWLAPDFDRMEVGWESYQADAARTIWIDDVALATQRIGCPP